MDCIYTIHCRHVHLSTIASHSPIHTHMQPAIELLRKHQVSSCHLETEVSRCPWVMLWKPHGCQKKYQISFIHTICFLNEWFLVSPSPDVLGGRPSRGEVPRPVAARFSACSVSGWPSLLQRAQALLVRTSGPCWGTNLAPAPGPGKPLTAGVEHMPATPLPDALWPGDITNRWLLSELQRHKGWVKTIWFKVISQRVSNKRMCYAHYNFRACFGTWNNFTVEPFQLFLFKCWSNILQNVDEDFHCDLGGARSADCARWGLFYSWEHCPAGRRDGCPLFTLTSCAPTPSWPSQDSGP